jgi:hypothetical protein
MAEAKRGEELLRTQHLLGSGDEERDAEDHLQRQEQPG